MRIERPNTSIRNPREARPSLDALTIDHGPSAPARREADRPARLVPTAVMTMNARTIRSIRSIPAGE